MPDHKIAVKTITSLYILQLKGPTNKLFLFFLKRLCNWWEKLEFEFCSHKPCVVFFTCSKEAVTEMIFF